MKLRALTIIHEYYADFGPTLAHEKLTERHGIHISVETLRQWMIADGLWVPHANASLVFISLAIVVTALSAYTFSNQLRLVGPSMTLVDGSTYYDKNQVVTVYFEGDNANTVAQIHGQSFAHNFTRQPDTDSVAALAGTHTNSDTGETWSIDTAGNITINGMCTISGQLIDSAGFYHKASATATGCDVPDFNGDYQGFVFSVTYDGTKVLAGMLYNNNSSMWSYVLL